MEREKKKLEEYMSVGGRERNTGNIRTTYTVHNNLGLFFGQRVSDVIFVIQLMRVT